MLDETSEDNLFIFFSDSMKQLTKRVLLKAEN